MTSLEQDYIRTVFEHFAEPEYFGIDSVTNKDADNPAYQRAWKLLHLKLKQYLTKKLSDKYMKQIINEWSE